MVHVAHALAVLCYAGAAALAAAPFARPMAAPLRGVLALLAGGVGAHVAALGAVGLSQGQVPLTGLGPALSFAGMVLALNLLVVEAAAREVTMTLAAAPLAALCTAAALAIGFRPVLTAQGARAVWLDSHIALSFLGIGALATAAAAGAMYLVERRELKARRFGAILRFFPPLETLDRVNHVAAVTGWLVLTLGVVLAVTYSAEYEAVEAHKLVWALAAWLGASALAIGRLLGWWRARRAALLSGMTFVAVVVLYVALRVVAAERGQFL
ncbi:MAG: cytochrome c biogenesis protein CcsA [Gemmatimonadaceae bacterium]